jgi:hypothetical protein
MADILACGSYSNCAFPNIIQWHIAALIPLTVGVTAKDFHLFP